MFVKSLEKQITVAIITSAIGGYVLICDCVRVCMFVNQHDQL